MDTNGRAAPYVDTGHCVKNTPERCMDNGVDICAANCVSRKERLFFRDR